VSARPRALDFMVRHRIKGVIGGGAATMAEGPVHGYREAAARAGRELALGQDLCLGIFSHLAETREKAIREITPYYEEHVKMFGPLGFVPGITPAQVEASSRRGGWGAAGVPTVEHYMKTGAWFAGPPEDLIAYLKDLESRFPGLEHVNVSTSMGTPAAVMREQLAWFAREVMPKFGR
jgi:alkanesulfonate monooxygenase SsuD/methylene tetrahydromethanopterin reductase-like flavin-dependent oxidoreductase (luciferase family)